jgi:endo-1,4-beta-xylanase
MTQMELPPTATSRDEISLRPWFCLGIIALAAFALPAFPQSALAADPARAAQPTLREVSGNRWLMGAAVTSEQLRDPKLAGLITSQFDSLTAEFEFFPQFLHPEPRKYTFERADRIADFAVEHHLSLTGHMLCWGQFTPAWMFQAADGKPLGREAALANLKNHIDAVVGHFRGKVVSWNVVNEGLSDAAGEYLRDTPARRAIGDDYIAEAFEYAHAADPSALLYYNDYNIEDPAKLAKTLKLVRSLRAAGVRLDAIGIQGHWLLDYPDVKVIDAALTAFGEEKIKVMITELDVDVLSRGESGADLAHIQGHGANPYVQGLPPQVAEAEARRYADIFKIFKEHADVISSITFWGVDDGRSWLNGYPVKGRTNYPLLFDRDLAPKPAFKSVIDVLRSQ